MVIEVQSGAPLFPGASEIDQIFKMIGVLGPLPPPMHDAFLRRPALRGCHVQMPPTKSLAQRYPKHSAAQLALVASCLAYDASERPICAELLGTAYFCDDALAPDADASQMEAQIERLASLAPQRGAKSAACALL
jgi:serine/threonine protein kinase